MIVPWVREELETVELHDKRLKARMMKIATALGEHSTASIPGACGGYAEMAAAYRFFDNDKVTLDRVIAPHVESTLRRMRDQAVVLLVQDTSEIDLSRPDQQMVGAGSLDGSSRRGAFLHLLQAFTPDGTPLGTVWQQVWAREEDDPSKTAAAKRKERKAAPIEDKESFRWVEGLRRASLAAESLPGVQCVCIADSEADIYELLSECCDETKSIDWIVRACQDRALAKADADADDSHGTLRAKLLEQPVLYSQTIDVRGRRQKVACETRGRRQAREDRQAFVEVRAAQVTLRPPYRSDRTLPEATVNVALVWEPNPPAGEEPVEWLLLTTQSIGDVDEVRLVIERYCSRWMIELFFKTLKSGCRVEQRRFERLDRWLPCLGIYLIVTWRTLYLCRLGRASPDLSCAVVLEPSEWKATYMVATGKKPPRKPPSLQEMIRLIAQLGGYVNRARDDEPGPQTVWLGLQRMHDLAMGWQTFGPGSQSAEKEV